MIGPSSSHTAGACKIGQMARALFHKQPGKVTFILHGSFAEVYQGHATDKALVAGIIRLKTGDPKIKHSFELAAKKGIEFQFKKGNLGPEYHPNTAKIIMEKNGRPNMTVIGSSIGGGKSKIVKIDDFPVDLNIQAGFKTIVVWHDNNKTHLTQLCNKIEKNGNNIHNIQTTTISKEAISIINTDGPDFTLSEIKKLEKQKGIKEIRSLIKLQQ